MGGCQSQSSVGSFSVDDYQYYIDKFPSSEVVGSITSAKDATKKAETIWLRVYGKDVLSKKPYQVFFDSANEVWMVQGRLPPFMDGGVPYILIDGASGNVLAVWHDK